MNFSELKIYLLEFESSEILIVGLGNVCCSDDKAGIELFEKLKNMPGLEDSCFINAGCNPENYLMRMIEQDPKLIMFIDAVEDKDDDVIIKIYNSNEIDDKDFSTHAYSIGFIEKFIKMSINPQFIYLGINIQNSRPGNKLSYEIIKQINTFIEQ